MPIHDWTRVPSGLFHEFHQSWSVRLKDALNRGILGENYYALVEQRVDGPEPDVIAVQTQQPDPSTGGTATLVLPETRTIQRVSSEAAGYARRANRISVRHHLGDVVAIIEIVSPGNKDSRNALRSFVQKAATFLRNGVHLLIIDLFPPSDRDPQGIHGAIWNEVGDEAYTAPEDKPLTVASYHAADEMTAYIQPVAVGDPLPSMALFLGRELFVIPPLETSYLETWEVCPAPIKRLVQPPP